MSEKNNQVLEALERLAGSLSQLNVNVNVNDSSNLCGTAATAPAPAPASSSNLQALSHWRDLPEQVDTSYKMMQKGASLVEATATKYTLVGTIDANEGSKLAQELLQGCQFVVAGAFVLCGDDTTNNNNNHAGCSRSTKQYVKQSSRAIVATVISLVESFRSGQALEQEGLGAQKTGAVWSTCQAMQKIPKGNRSAMRRDLLTWTVECNETMIEFTDMVDLGPCLETNSDNANDNANDDANDNANDDDDDQAWDDFLQGGSDQYTPSELPIAQACVALFKCSRGSLNVALQACECAGQAIPVLSTDVDPGDERNNTTTNNNTNNSSKKTLLLAWIHTLHTLGREIGEGVTELGTLLYPPLELNKNHDCALTKQIILQRDAIVRLHDFCLDATIIGESESDDLSSFHLTAEINDLSVKLKSAAQRRYQEADDAVAAVLSTK